MRASNRFRSLAGSLALPRARIRSSIPPDNSQREDKGISLGEQSSSVDVTGKGNTTQPTAEIVQHSSVLCARLHVYKRDEIDNTISEASAPLCGKNWGEIGAFKSPSTARFLLCRSIFSSPLLYEARVKSYKIITRWGVFHPSPVTPRGRLRSLGPDSHERARCRCNSP